jgi:hypothetical protein
MIMKTTLIHIDIDIRIPSEQKDNVNSIVEKVAVEVQKELPGLEKDPNHSPITVTVTTEENHVTQ